ncbi:MAG: efflux RND transporter permease subunit [Mariprofundales bacterium]
MKGIISFFVERGLMVNLLSLMLLAGGIFAAMNIQREAFPSVNFDLIIINAFYQGASPEEMEQLLLIPIERQLKGIDGIKQVRAAAYMGTMQITIEVDPNFKDRSRLVSDVQQGIDRADLPNDLAADPILMEIKSEQAPILSFTAFGDFSPLEIKHIADSMEDDLLNIDGVARVTVQGTRKEEIRITLNPERMHKKRISTNDVIQLIKGWNISAPGGEMKHADGQRLVRVVGEFLSAEDAGSLVLRANERGDAVYLRDIATVEHTLEQPRRYLDAMGKPAINFVVLKKGSEDIISLVDRVRDYLDTVPAQYDNKLTVRTYLDFSTITRLRLGVLTSNGAIGLGLVLLCLLLMLRPAVAFTTAWGLPIIFFSGLLTLYLGGVTLNLLTMFGFIIVLGLMVDDAIIIGENITYYMERGLNPHDAAIQGTVELIGPVTATVLTTIVAFMPLMFMAGIIGKFIAAIPLVVVVLLFYSWLESLFILPNHIRDVASIKKHSKERLLLRILNSSYLFIVRIALKLRYLTVIGSVIGLGACLLLTQEMEFKLFPPGAENEFYLRITAPSGTTLEQMREILRTVEADARKRVPARLLETTIANTGLDTADERDEMKQIGSRYGFVRVALIPFNIREVTANKIMKAMERDMPARYPNLKMNFVMMKAGPPVGRALKVELTGSDYAAIKRTADRLSHYLATIDGVHSIEDGMKPGDDEVRVILDRKLAAYAQVDLATTATHIKAAFDGVRVSSLRRSKREIDVTIRFPEKLRNDMNTLRKLRIPNRMGGLIPLERIAKFEIHPGISNLRHKEGLRVIDVSAEVRQGIITSRNLNKTVEENKDRWLGDDVDNVRYHLGGEEERTQESVRGLIFSFAYALAGIFIILAIQFNRLSYPFLVMSAIPFGMIGIIIGFYVHEQPLSFMAMMGFVALAGVVVNASLVLAVFIQRLLDEGMPWREAIIQGSVRRLRAVLLTALTTVVGLLPTAYGWGGHDPFVAPMALALGWGLMFSTVITLFTIPALLGIVLDIRNASLVILHILQRLWLFLNKPMFSSQ